MAHEDGKRKYPRKVYKKSSCASRKSSVKMENWVPATGARRGSWSSKDATPREGRYDKRMTEYRNPESPGTSPYPCRPAAKIASEYFQRYIADSPAG